MEKRSYVYIITNYTNNVIYTGVTGNLFAGIYRHKKSDVPGFTKRYNVDKLVYYEVYDNIINAITREKQIKKWRRIKKIELIMSMNPDWVDLYDSL